MQIEEVQKSQSSGLNVRKELGNYVFGKTLGQGTFGKVKLATHKSTGQLVAVKILQKDKIVDVADVERVSREIHILKLVRHPNIIQLYEIIETPKQLFLVMEYIEKGQLFHYIVNNKRVDEEQACRMFHELISGIEYIHKLSIVHRDLKPENLLLDFNFSVKIVDFGLSNTYKKDQTLKTPCGSPCYAAPEMIKGSRYNGLRVDIWSSGVILFAMICGCLPFQDDDTSKLYKKILSGKFTPTNGISESAKDLLSKVLNVDPEKRYSIEQIRQHEWMKKAKNTIDSSGIIIGYNRIPVESAIISQLSSVLKLESDYITKCVEANRHNSVTTAYYLTFKKYIKAGNHSQCDMSSASFNRTLIEPNTRSSLHSKSKGKNIIIDVQTNKENRNEINKDITSLTNFDIVIKDCRKPQLKFLSTKPQQTGRKSLKSKNNSKSNIRVHDKSIKFKENESKELTSKELVRQPCHKDFGSTSTFNNRINKKYRQEFNKSLVSRSREKERSSLASTKNQDRMRVISTQSYKSRNDRIESSISLSKDKNKSQLMVDLVRKDVSGLENISTRKNVNNSIEIKKHRRGKSGQLKKAPINQSFHGLKNGDAYYKRSRI